MIAVVVIGPPGSGKTSAITALHDLLADDDVGHAVVELEAVAWSHPPLTDEQSFMHLSSMCRLYAQAGFHLIVVGATATSQRYLAGVIEAIGADDTLVVRLDADALTLRQRIIAREPAGWSGLSRLLDAAAEIAPLSRSLSGVDLDCSTDHVPPATVAALIRERFLRVGRP